MPAAVPAAIAVAAKDRKVRRDPPARKAKPVPKARRDPPVRKAKPVPRVRRDPPVRKVKPVPKAPPAPAAVLAHSGAS